MLLFGSGYALLLRRASKKDPQNKKRSIEVIYTTTAFLWLWYILKGNRKKVEVKQPKKS